MFLWRPWNNTSSTRLISHFVIFTMWMIFLLVFHHVVRQWNSLISSTASIHHCLSWWRRKILPFLDVLVKRDCFSFTTSVYMKTTFMGLYIWVGSLLHPLHGRLTLYCSDSRIESEIRKVTDIFLKNRYPDNVISNCMRSMIIKFNTCKSFGPLKCSVYIKLLWIGMVSQVFADNISKSVTHWFYSTKVRTNYYTYLFVLSKRRLAFTRTKYDHS